MSAASGSRQTWNKIPVEQQNIVVTEALAAFVDYYNNHRYHESLNNRTPADVYFGRSQQILEQRKRIKEATLKERRRAYIARQQAVLYNNIFTQNPLSQKKEGF